eukprot:13516452-Alexandrium_andersonii.AAC.1
MAGCWIADQVAQGEAQHLCSIVYHTLLSTELAPPPLRLNSTHTWTWPPANRTPPEAIST